MFLAKTQWNKSYSTSKNISIWLYRFFYRDLRDELGNFEFLQWWGVGLPNICYTFVEHAKARQEGTKFSFCSKHFATADVVSISSQHTSFLRLRVLFVWFCAFWWLSTRERGSQEKCCFYRNGQIWVTAHASLKRRRFLHFSWLWALCLSICTCYGRSTRDSSRWPTNYFHCLSCLLLLISSFSSIVLEEHYGIHPQQYRYCAEFYSRRVESSTRYIWKDSGYEEFYVQLYISINFTSYSRLYVFRLQVSTYTNCACLGLERLCPGLGICI